MYQKDKYEKIIDIMCSMKGIEKEELYKILKDRECKYLLFLLLKKYKCDDLNKINQDFSINNKRVIKYNEKKGEEKFLINKEFRETYFEVQEKVDKVN
ncbi:ribose-5-phosphate isomerase [Clostridium ganghwense]|uniref:Ribose-5-phosphate isomerase n=1 Tax=Clostridium ganghwense TaxID=312089 RepID=A0ABT4CP35_9CLOT|nr:ribose-5-phosphate isomerase [Clostridium ganghwense]MCY6369841.1 ribose-5-phosphate isomerase [Clostridium ganghwense]